MKEIKNNIDSSLTIFKFSNGLIEISGSEEFVSKQIEDFKSVFLEIINSYISGVQSIQRNHSSSVLPAKMGLPERAPSKKKEDDYAEFEEIDNQRKLKDYENVFVVDGDKVQIVCDMPGNSTGKKMINLVLIYLWIKHRLNVLDVSFSELREICELHGEIDKPNFAKYMRLNRKYFIIGGTGKNQTAKLIRPGIKEAENLIEELNQKAN